MSSVPMVFANLHAVERLMNFWPGPAAMEDDLRDQWRSYVHEKEYVRLIRLLGGLARDRHLQSRSCPARSISAPAASSMARDSTCGN